VDGAAHTSGGVGVFLIFDGLKNYVDWKGKIGLMQSSPVI